MPLKPPIRQEAKLKARSKLKNPCKGSLKVVKDHHFSHGKKHVVLVFFFFFGGVKVRVLRKNNGIRFVVPEIEVIQKNNK